MTSISSKIVLLTVFLVLGYTKISRAQGNLRDEIKNDKIAALLEEKLAFFPNQTEISLALIDNKQSEFFGIIRKSDTLQTKTNQNAIFEIGSVTKVFTSTLLAALVIEEKLSLNDRVVDLLPFKLETPSEDQENITLKTLANHTSGLPALPQNIMPLIALDESDPYHSYTSDKLHEYLKTDFKTESRVGEKSTYSNLGAGLLGHLLTLKTKKSYEALLQEKIFKPLGMNSSTTVLKQVSEISLVRGLGPQGQVVSNWNFDVLEGAGAIKSSVTDLEKFVRMHMGNSSVYNLTQNVTHIENKQVSLGLGWHIISQGDQKILFHNGGTEGYTSCVLINKETQKSVIMLTNISTFHPKRNVIDTLCFEILNLIN
ncbi:serine hydrolase domain-containing protein [Flavivirga algicola]|uniref:Beta-lactamase family protein n=1 Tax=Flavivirga algicola TaxID=2729136 RepID=A0ABX1RX49_9FLAO|nr:serine hydrolase domain-containing protein [Flavivirga algicola]NMH87258.1 beta-lactamase family protein [Flavivirga algicola]